MVDNHELMVNNFRNAMMKLAVVGQDTRKLIDCSELIPEPKPAVKLHATYVLIILSSLINLRIISDE